MNNTKVIVSIGPSNFSVNYLKELILNGMDVIRLNMSYCTHDFCLKVIDAVNILNRENSKKISILLDIAGPEIKIGNIENESSYLSQGDKIRVYMEDVLPEKMVWNLEAVRNFGFLREIGTMFRTVLAVLGKEYR